MHFHLHIKECVENYGSMYGFWLFSFERYDGILGSFHAANNREVDVQLMRRFLTMSALDDLKYLRPPEFLDHPFPGGNLIKILVRFLIRFLLRSYLKS